MASVTLENEMMRVGVEPDYGARIVGILDKISGRDWLSAEDPVVSDSDDAVFGAAQAVGWDECFPAVSPWDASDTMWSRPLRDHGELWGRPWATDESSETSLTTTFSTPAFRFSRQLAIEEATLEASYTLVNRTSEDMPYLWALHALLAVTPADRIVLPSVTSVSATYLALAGELLDHRSVPWPRSGGKLPFKLDEVQPASRNFAGKFYAPDMTARRAAVGHGSEWLVVAWDDTVDHLGVWLNYGGWMRPFSWHRIALEPTTGPVDDLGQALQTSCAAWVAPEAAARWTITLTLAKDVS